MSLKRYHACECGRRKPRGSEACRRCLFLDQTNAAGWKLAFVQDIVESLRGDRWLTRDDLIADLAERYPDVGPAYLIRLFYRALKHLKAEGRIVHEDEIFFYEASGFGRTDRFNNTSARSLWRLNDRKAA